MFEANRARQKKRELAEQRAELQFKTEELRALKEQVKLDLEIQKLQQELEELKGEDDTLDEVKSEMSPEDAMMMGLMQKVLNQNPSPTPVVNTPLTSQPSQVATTTGVQYSDEQIKAYLSRVPKKNMLLLKSLDDDGIKEQILNVIKDADVSTIRRIINQIRA